MSMTKRDFLKSALFGAGYLGLRSLATGLPLGFLANPREALASPERLQALAGAGGQFLILSTSGLGDPVNCNVPGTYAFPDVIHAQDPSMAATSIRMGSSTVTGAQVWSAADPVTNPNGLPQWVLDRTCFFHHATFTNSHPNEPKVLRLMGETQHGECIPSIYAKALAPQFGTIQTEPLSVGAGDVLTFDGRALPNILPSTLADVLAPPGGPLDNLQGLRDQTLDQINGILKEQATSTQRSFIDSLVSSRQQVRSISDALLGQLQAITDNGPFGQIAAAVTLIQMKIAPVMVITIPFGGDNHADQDLIQREVPQHQTGVQAISTLMQTLQTAGLQDQVTFGLLNVFGRTLKSQGWVGRTHWANHHAGIVIGKNVKAGVVGGIVPTSDGGDFQATAIDSTTGAAVPSGSADIAFTDTLGAFAKTLGAALGIDSATLDANINQGKVVSGALVS